MSEHRGAPEVLRQIQMAEHENNVQQQSTRDLEEGSGVLEVEGKRGNSEQDAVSNRSMFSVQFAQKVVFLPAQ
jgi:hypothetical protein